MFVIKKLRIIVAVIALLLMTINAVGAQNYSVPAELEEYGSRVYQDARACFNGRSFNGYCGTYVRCQLKAMGIFNSQYDMRGNGNQWYSNFENVSMTSGGYYVYRESGNDCMDKLVANYGNDLSNIVLSFPIQAGYSAASPGAGHALVIYRLCDGIAYYSESFGFGKYSEGQVMAEDIDSLMERYSRRHGAALGCVLLSPVDLNACTEQEIAGIEPSVKLMLEKMSNITFIAAEFTEMSQPRKA